jgi:hypothetical protein
MTSDTKCRACPPDTCPGTMGHRLHDTLLALPLSSAELAALLHCSPESLVRDRPGPIIKLVRRLPWTELEHLSALTGFTHRELVDSITYLPTDYNGHTDIATLTAALIGAGFPGIALSDAAALLGWQLTRAANAARRLQQDQPPGTRVRTTADGRIALRADNDVLPMTARTKPPTHEDIELESTLATSLWQVFSTDDLRGVPARHRQRLHDAGLITIDGQRVRLRYEVEYSLGAKDDWRLPDTSQPPGES